ncbi:MAG: LCP family protein [Oscillospiraceae bacterium]|nr:LCP family protein [Oscillospiraceae bacterium]MBQ2223461.1 LCP family protein [Oscillospiraceae bacterium]MBQ2607294.1 LCP family protein [Oscillospiraceae bacterium]
MKTKNKPKRRVEQLVASLLSLLFLTTAAVATVKYLVRAPEPDQAPPAVEDAAAQQAPEQDDQAVPTTNGRARKQYCYTILLSGLDNDNGGSDTNILMRFDAVHKSINLVSLPRDTLLNHTWRSNKLNFAYASGGTELLRKEISNLLGIPVDFHVTVDLKGFISLVDQIGGVDFDVPVNMDYDDPYQDLHIHYAKGMRHLNGQQAMEVVRWRKNNDGTGYATADIGRIGTQQAFLTQVARQLLSVKNVPAMAEVFLKYVKTDLKLGNLVWLGNEALDIGMEGVSFYTLPGDGSGWYKGESVYALDPEATLALVNEALNPYVDPISMEDMDICIP